MFKKITALLAAIILAIGVSACSNSSTTTNEAETVSVKTLNAEGKEVDIEVKNNAQKIAILDLAVLDMLDAWNLADRVVGMPKGSQVEYLKKYNENDNIKDLEH
ncbi:hypothetical protein [Mycoplasma sp. P36-A1]|uniref:hypothetical protein n=1 Tax=Mycoplasma sp. P36-A1 TaxID=3252900 RepID=UPI003C2B2CD1